MKKLILTTVVYDSPNSTLPVTKQHLVAINSSKDSSPAWDIREAVKAVESYYETLEPSVVTKILSIVAEPTIDADNPEPQALYTEADLVSFGNFMANKVITLTSYQEKSGPDLTSLSVWDSDLANWRHGREKGESRNQNPRDEIRDYQQEKATLSFVEEMCAKSLAPDEYEKWNNLLNILRTRRGIN